LGGGRREGKGAHEIGRLSRQFSFLTPREQLYCQNLSLFGKLFIDIKTLFFDCDNCGRQHFRRSQDVAYALEQSYFISFTDADSQRDHVLGFFSKVTYWTRSFGTLSNLTLQEKISYDDYNLACIVVLPPYQKKGYGMLLIEFSMRISLLPP
jgi:histone acetyltransferase MYST1